ncbi:unnamed protein product [Trifolium pratense]|uniref:Uncharacterized protein n=1 Tax=Trifolium pratense TaxID=57577 RepID=A0ACB0JVI1_TRIPR|nr:unnamed protein product [Trifolium pratense]
MLIVWASCLFVLFLVTVSFMSASGFSRSFFFPMFTTGPLLSTTDQLEGLASEEKDARQICRSLAAVMVVLLLIIMVVILGLKCKEMRAFDVFLVCCSVIVEREGMRGSW